MDSVWIRQQQMSGGIRIKGSSPTRAWGSMSYFDELIKAMAWLGQQPDTIFVGQSVVYPGNAMFKTLVGVPMEKRIELPVAEEMQMGISLGMALTGKTVISIYPRFDFLLLVMNQLVNHLDKLEEFTNGQFHARVIIRVGVGSKSPLYPGVQHCGDYTEGFRKMLNNVFIAHLDAPCYIMPCYQDAYKYPDSAILAEDANRYGIG